MAERVGAPTSPARVEDARWWRRRFLRVALVVSLIWVASGIAFGWIGRAWNDGDADERRGPPGFVFAIVGAAVLATFIAYRRLGRPVSELLGSADRIGAGDYAAKVRPSGPRSVRTLGTAFNDMAGRLASTEQSRRRFLADVTHELRTPLTVLQAEIEAQLDGIHPRDDAHLQLLRDQTHTLERLVDDLRTLALGDAGRLTLHPENVPIGAVVDDAVAAIRATAAAREIAVRRSGDANEMEATIDRLRIGQVLGNLLTNAVRHTPPGGTITVATARRAGAVVISVADTGPGLGADPGRVFDRFHAAADSGGSGLGLTIARQLVEAHGGRLDGADAPTGGAVFTVHLPTGSAHLGGER
jgi:two-component system sensor histidine kinase BaeS